jgi:purine nucleoside permease
MKRILITCALLLSSCGGSATAPVTPVPPNSAQTQVFNVNKTIADSIHGAVTASITLRDQGKISQATLAQVEAWAKAAVPVCDQIDSEIGSSDAWATQRVKILALLPQFKVPAIAGIDPSIQTLLSNVTTLIAQIQAQVTQ